MAGLMAYCAMMSLRRSAVRKVLGMVLITASEQSAENIGNCPQKYSIWRYH